ncbi:MAG: cytochrome c [Rhodothermales bacterium]
MNTRILLIISIIALFAGGAIWYNAHGSMPWNMHDNMPMSDHMNSGNGPVVAGLNIPALNTIEKLGERRFNENCAVCHGKNAAGNEGVGPPLVHIIYEPSHHGDMAFQLAAKQGVRAHHWPYGNMPPVPSVTENDVTNITAYVRALQRANGIN